MLGSEARQVAGDFEALRCLALPGDHVDDTQEGVAAVNGRARPSDHFHALDEINVHREFRADERFVINVVIGSVTVHQEQEVVVVTAVSANTSDPYIGVIPVVGQKESRNAPEDVSQGTVAISADLFGGNDGHRCGSMGDRLHVVRSTIDRLDLHLHEACKIDLYQRAGGRWSFTGSLGPGAGGRRRNEDKYQE